MTFLANILWKKIIKFNWIIIADNCSPSTLGMVKDVTGGIEMKQFELIEVSVGHGAGTFNLALDKALTYNDNEIIYFLENDYLHKHHKSSIYALICISS